MPKQVADVHNYFWRNFSAVGEPKVLDRIRYLFVKDKKGYISPFKVLIKFQYTPQYGYSFVGLLQKPKLANVALKQEVTTHLDETYFMICNANGTILEFSRSCRDLFYLTPSILNQLHLQIEEGLRLSIFNRNELSLSEFDFESSQSYFIKSIILNFSELNRLVRGIEVERDSEERDGA